MAETAVIVPVRAAQATIGRLQSAHTPAGRAGMVPHVTLLYPWLSGARPAEPLERLQRLLAGFPAFDVRFGRLARFTDGEAVAYAEPEPAAPFLAMTRALSAEFGIQPYGGVHTGIVPHMTVASVGSPDGLDGIEREAARMLPIDCRIEAAEVWVMRAGRWRFAHRVALAGGG